MPIPITMPQLSPTMTEGTVSRWLVNEGDAIASGDIIAEIETDKATMEIDAISDGVIGRILVDAGGEAIAVGTVIAVLLEEGEDASALEAIRTAPPAEQAPPPAAEEAAPPAPQGVELAASRPAPEGERVFASPLARRMAEQSGLDLATIAGTGPHGRIVKADIETALSGGAPLAKAAAATPAAAREAAPAAARAPSAFVPGAAEFEEIPNSNMRKVIARRLTEAKQTIPHFYLTIECELDRLLALRKDLNGRSGEYKLSVNDFIVRASALALMKVPTANASWREDAILQYRSADVAVAVATERGLITPIVRDAQAKGLAAISNELKELIERARAGKLLPEEYQGGTFSVSNLGMFGIREFSAVINPPHGAILAVGAGEQRPVVRDGALAVATMMSCTLSCDHRVVDGAVGAEFLAAFKGLIQDPVTMLL